jgi:glycosyltransferase involved in cell wall biosynthesis
LRIAIETGDLLRSRQAGHARYIRCLLASLVAEGGPGEVESWAPIRRIGNWLAAAGQSKTQFFFARPPNERPDIFHATSKVFPAWKARCEIATVHDLYIFSEELQLPMEERRRSVEYIDRADALICVSQHTRDHLHAVLNVPASRTHVISLAADPMFVPASEDEKQRVRHKYHLPKEFFLYIGRDRPNKNLDRLVQAYARTRLTVPLYLAGTHDKRTIQRLRRIANQHDCITPPQWLGPITDRDLPVLLSCASTLCMPSTFEGFGLPVIEAMACGTAVVTSSGTATEEAAGGHAVLVDPKSTESIADGLIRSLTRSETELEAARRYAVSRTWKDIAAETWQVYRRCS